MRLNYCGADLFDGEVSTVNLTEWMSFQGQLLSLNKGSSNRRGKEIRIASCTCTSAQTRAGVKNWSALG